MAHLAGALVFALSTIIPVEWADVVCHPPKHVLATGKPNYRRPHLTPEILANQLAMGHITQAQVDNPDLAGYVGTMDCSQIGQHVGITWPTGEETWPYLVIDCRNRDLPPLPDRPWVAAAEFDKDEWHRHYDWGLWARRETITVWQPDLTDLEAWCTMDW